jgi:hypothetical protein
MSFCPPCLATAACNDKKIKTVQDIGHQLFNIYTDVEGTKLNSEISPSRTDLTS